LSSPPPFAWDDWYNLVGGRSIRTDQVDEYLHRIYNDQYQRFDGEVSQSRRKFSSPAALVVACGGSFRIEDARRIGQPTLAVAGARSLEMDPIWGERHQLLLDWLPNVESFVLPAATHLLQIENPRDMAQALSRFFGRHALAPSA
jgi:pimeloyl-ACP methyl ester carboxylesterase